MAQQKDIYTSYGTDDGLPQSSVWSIVQDKRGFLWIGTSDGICRFDGYNFVSYRGDVSDSSFFTGSIYSKFYCDSNGKLWAISQNGVGVYDRISDRFTPLFLHPGSFGSYNCFLGEDSFHVFAGITQYGILKINKYTHQVTAITNDILKPVFSWLVGVICNGEVWIAGNRSNSHIYNLKTGELSKLSPVDIMAMMDYNDSEIVAASYNEVYLFKKKGHSYKTVIRALGEKKMKSVTGILRIPDSRLMIATSEGVYYIDTKSWSIQKHVQSFVEGQQHAYKYVQCIYRDRSGNIWLGTNGDGLKKLTAPYKRFKQYTPLRAKSTLVKAIYADNKNLYVGYYGNGIDIFNRDTGLIKSVATNKNPTKTSSVLAITALDSERLIFQNGSVAPFATYVSDVGVKNISGVFQKALPQKKLLTGYPFFIHRDNIVYSNLGDNCLISFDASNPHALNPKLLHCIPDEVLSCGFRDKSGTLWLGTFRGVFYIENNVLKKVPLREQAYIKAIDEDNDGNIWLAATRGIYVLGPGKQQIRFYNESNGLSNQFVYGLLRDDGGNMWLSHNKGLSMFNTKAKTFTHYEREDGLQSNEFNTGAFFKAADGELFFGGINGVTSFDPREIRQNPHAPEVVITSIKLFDMPMKVDTAYWNIHSLSLPHSQNSLSFEFAALEFTTPRKNQYAYMMEGLDQTWINSGDRRFARYALLPPGRYVFKVKASNNDGVWQKEPASIIINIIPPFWQLLWFRILAGLLLIGVIAGIIIWLQQQKHKRMIRAMELQQKIQMERQRISRDLHDTVGTQLSLISNNIEWVTHPLKEITADEKEEKLQFVNNTARDIIATLRETIWALNKQQITLEEFSDKLKVFIQKHIAIYPGIKLEFNEQVGEGIILGPSEALNLFRICQEAITNALKYASASVLAIHILNDNGTYKITIADNGAGFDMSAVDASVQNGLENMKYRAQDINCILVIDTSVGGGTRVTVTKKMRHLMYCFMLVGYINLLYGL
jgi:signal transduction histidine kinase/sugar lactone lactonase YvrE